MSYELVLTFRIILLSLMLLASLFIIFAVVKQPGNSDGMSSITGSSQTDTFYGKNKAKRFENQLKKLTIIAGIILAVCAVLFFVLAVFTGNASSVAA